MHFIKNEHERWLATTIGKINDPYYIRVFTIIEITFYKWLEIICGGWEILLYSRASRNQVYSRGDQ